MGACVSAGGEREDDGGMRNAKCEMRMRRMRLRLAACVVWGGGDGACACESAKRHANAGCESADMPSGMQMRRGHADAKGA